VIRLVGKRPACRQLRERRTTHSAAPARAARQLDSLMMRIANCARMKPDAALLLIGHLTAGSPRTQPSGRGRPDDCMARIIRKSNRARSTSNAALLLP
jgi:hypothetical protein